MMCSKYCSQSSVSCAAMFSGRRRNKRNKNVCFKALLSVLFRVNQVLRLYAVQYFVQILSGFVAGHGQVLQQIVATVFGRRARNVALVACDEVKGSLHQGHDVLAFQVAVEYEVVARKAAHGAPIDDSVLPFVVVAQEGGCQVLYGMDGAVVQYRLTIGLFHAYVERRDRFVAYPVLATYVDTAPQ